LDSKRKRRLIGTEKNKQAGMLSIF